MKRVLLTFMTLISCSLALDIDETNNHWGTGGNVASPVVLNESVHIPSGETLIIEAGTEIVFQKDIFIVCNGQIDARGNVENFIKFYPDNEEDYLAIDISIENNGSCELQFCVFISASLNIKNDNNSLIRNSIFINNLHEGISLTGTTNRVLNNTIVSILPYNGSGIGLEGETNETIKNNIIHVAANGIRGSNSSNAVNNIKYNLLSDYCYRPTISLPDLDGSNLISLDPLFVDPDNRNFRLKPESPAIDAGDPTDDYSNEPNDGGGRINLGAYGNTSEATLAETSPIISNLNSKSTTKIAVNNNELHFTNSALYAVEIFSVNGKLLKELSGTETKVSLISFDLANGIYQMRVTQGTEVFTGQFILK